jgi:hypothetical protein
MNYYEHIEPYEFFNLKSDYLQLMGDYISNLKSSDYTHHEYEFTDDYLNEHFDRYRYCKIHYPSEDSIFYKIGIKIFKEINNKIFKYNLTNVVEFQILRYHEGGNYNWHCDYGISPHNQLTRKLSMSIQLSESSEYTGGDLDMIDYSNRTIKLQNCRGCGVVFDSRIPHKANPVISGVRDVLVGWASGPRLR